MDMNRAWRDEFDAAAARPLDLRLRYAFVHTYKPVLDDQPYRSFESTADYRRWCNENLPDCSSARREPSSTASRTPRRMQTCSSRRRCAMGSTLTWCSRQTESNGSRTRNPTSAKGLPRVSQRTGPRTPSTPPRTEVSGPRIGTLRSTLRRCRHDARRGHRPAGRGGAGRAESVNPLRRDRRHQWDCQAGRRTLASSPGASTSVHAAVVSVRSRLMPRSIRSASCRSA